MNPTERIIAAIDGKEAERVPTFSYYLDYWPVQQVLGKPLISTTALTMNPVSGLIYDLWGKKISPVLLHPILDAMMMKSIEAAAVLGFDSVVALFERSFFIWDSKTLARYTGSFYDIIDDGHGNAWYMYRGPAFTTPKDFDAWPYFPDLDDLAHATFKFYKKAQKKFGDKICLLGQAAFGIHESMLWALGFANLALWVRREPAAVHRFIVFLEELIMKTNMAMMDAGIRVIFNGDDFAHKTGPIFNPKTNDELFGDSYRRITKAVHDRGGRCLLHSCGDNTKMFDYFINWGYDGGHAYENTSNVDIAHEKKAHGDVFTIVGGVGVDHILTERSTADEVRAEVKKLIDLCAPGGRFLIGPVHDHPDMDMTKVKLMLETCREYGGRLVRA